MRAGALVSDREFRVEGRRRVRNVADVGGAGALPWDDAILDEPHSSEVQAGALGEDRVRTEVEVGLLLVELQFAAGCLGGRLENRLKAGVHAAQVVAVARPRQKFATGELRDDVRSRAPLDDESLHSRVVAQLLAPERNTVVRVHERVQRVDSLVRMSRGVSRLATERPLPVSARQCVLRRCGSVRWVKDEHGVAVVEQSVVAERNLAATTFLGGGADEGHAGADPTSLQRAGKRDAGTRRGRGDEVVSARVAEAAERVVLADKRNMGAGVSVPCHERRRHPRHTALDAEAVLLDDAAEQTRRLDLLEADLGELMNRARCGDQLIGARAGRLMDRILDFDRDSRRHGVLLGGYCAQAWRLPSASTRTRRRPSRCGRWSKTSSMSSSTSP